MANVFGARTDGSRGVVAYDKDPMEGIDSRELGPEFDL
jgi:hypothetical protein